ncbi:RICIN domain-containing protein, partial [Devosia sp.]|uniref:RICIN domain-containing protein n=1 Tax=Devosia sp. TaxID=1871048 RepID=UPI002FCC1E21
SGGYDQLGYGTLTYSVNGPVEDGRYAILSLNSSMLLDAANGGVVNGTGIIQWPYNGGANQVWQFEHLGASKYRITGLASGRALDVSGGAKSDGSTVHLWDYFGRANQIWRVTPIDNQFFRLCPTHAPASCLDVQGASGVRGAQVQLWRYWGGFNQQWMLAPR